MADDQGVMPHQRGQRQGRHQARAIDNLKMPAMTMVFRGRSALLQDLKVGDAVRFHAENPAGKLTVTAIQKQ